MKSEILKTLRETEGYISGQELCDRFSVSRTAIWKVINQLKEEGYSIEAVRNKGYHMIEGACPDVMNLESIKSHMALDGFGQELVYYSEVDSTNIQAKVLAEQGNVHGTLLVADMQQAGKGRRGRSWASPAGTGISMSLLLRPTFAPQKAPMLTLVMALSVVNAMMRYGKEVADQELDIQIKWPNDIVVNGKKVCGILTEMSTEIDYINYVVIGVGINANMETFPVELEGIATSLKKESGITILRAKLIALIIEEFQKQYDKYCEIQDLSFLQEEYNGFLVNKDRQVKVLEPGNEYEAIAMGIDDEGQLLVRRGDDEIVKVYAGEVSVRGIYGYV